MQSWYLCTEKAVEDEEDKERIVEKEDSSREREMTNE